MSSSEESDISDSEEWERNDDVYVCKLPDVMALPQVQACNQKFTQRGNLDLHRLRTHNRAQITFMRSGKGHKHRRRVDKPPAKKWTEMEHKLSKGYDKLILKNLRNDKKAALEKKYARIEDVVKRTVKVTTDLVQWEKAYKEEMESAGKKRLEQHLRATAWLVRTAEPSSSQGRGVTGKEKGPAAKSSSGKEDRDTLALVPRQDSGRPTKTRTQVAALTDDGDDNPILSKWLARKTAVETAAAAAAAETLADEGKETRNKKRAPAARVSDDGGSRKNRKTVAASAPAPTVGEEDEGEEAGSTRKSKRQVAAVAATSTEERAVSARRKKKRRQRELAPGFDDSNKEEQDGTNEQTGPAKANAFLRRLKHAAKKAPEKQTTTEQPEQKKGKAEREAEKESEVMEKESVSLGLLTSEAQVRVQTDEQNSESVEKLEVENLQLRDRLASVENELGQEKAKQRDLEAKQKDLEAKHKGLEAKLKDLEAKQKGLEVKQKDVEDRYASKLAMLESEVESERVKNKQLEVEVGKAEETIVRLHQDFYQRDSLYREAVDNEEEAWKDEEPV